MRLRGGGQPQMLNRALYFSVKLIVFALGYGDRERQVASYCLIMP